MIDHRFADFHEIIQGKPVPGQTSTGAFFFFVPYHNGCFDDSSALESSNRRFGCSLILFRRPMPPPEISYGKPDFIVVEALAKMLKNGL